MTSSRSARWVVLVLAVGALVALVRHAYSAGFLSVSADEFAKIIIARRGVNNPSMWFGEVWLPLHFLLLAAADLLTGDLLLASRVLSIGFGVLLIVALWGIGRESGGEFGAGLAAILGATHPLVVLLSATAMVDICYVSVFLLGVRFYLKVSRSSHTNPMDLVSACGLMTLACAFHYNAWIVTLLMVPFLLDDLCRGDVPRPIVALSILLLTSVPMAWVTWNWVDTGHPLAFYSQHQDYTEKVWASWGWHPSPRAALGAVGASIRFYSPVLAILAFSGMGPLFWGQTAMRRRFLLLTLLLGFLAVLVAIYASGGRPCAFDSRYILLPSILMIAIASGSLGRLRPPDPGTGRVAGRTSYLLAETGFERSLSERAR